MSFRNQSISVTGDFDISASDISNTDIHIDSGSVFCDSPEWYRNLRNVRITRTGTVGPALIMRDTRTSKNSRFNWSNIIVAGSSGTGVEFQGVFLGAITGLFVRDCEGDGIVLKPCEGQSKNVTGSNALGIFGGEVQKCDIGISATNTKGVCFTGFTVEGTREVGVKVVGSRSFNMVAPTFENCGKHVDRRDASDIYLEGENQNINITGGEFSDGADQHRKAIASDGNDLATSIRDNRFWAYSYDIPVDIHSYISSGNLAKSPVNQPVIF